MRFSSGSATRSCISCAVAPGHTAATVNTLIVKVGSSARPSFRKAKMPATTIAISKNRVIAFSCTARADRLRNLFAAYSRTSGPEVPYSWSNFSFSSDVWCWLIGFLPCSLRARVGRREEDELQALRSVVLGAGPRRWLLVLHPIGVLVRVEMRLWM